MKTTDARASTGASPRRPFYRRWPFLTLAAFTLLVGAGWHLAGLTRESSLYPIVHVIGLPFIQGMRLATRLFGASGAARLAGFLLGLAPYVVGEVILWRARRATQLDGGTSPSIRM